MADTTIPAGHKLFCWYCPALSAYRFPNEELIDCWKPLLTRFPWIALYSAENNQAPEGWVLRSYYCPDEKAFYASHRTISEKTIVKSLLVELYAAPGASGNENAGHVPPKLK